MEDLFLILAAVLACVFIDVVGSPVIHGEDQADTPQHLIGEALGSTAMSTMAGFSVPDISTWSSASIPAVVRGSESSKQIGSDERRTEAKSAGERARASIPGRRHRADVLSAASHLDKRDRRADSGPSTTPD